MEPYSRKTTLFQVVAVVVVIILQVQLASATIGAHLGLVADNLPTPEAMISQYKAENIFMLRLSEPNTEVMNALRGSVIKVAIGVKKDDVQDITLNVNAAIQWVASNVAPFVKEVDIGWITVGYVYSDASVDKFLPQAMNNILSGLNTANLTHIKVSTVAQTTVLGDSSPPHSPPSVATFSPEATESMQGIVTWLAGTNNPLFIDVIPYSSYISDPNNVPLDYALNNAQQPLVDGQYKYYGLFEAMVDALYVALEKVGGGDIALVVHETGWPSAGGDPSLNKQNAQAYNQNLIYKMMNSGTPRKPSTVIDIFISSMYNENKKQTVVDQNWGIHYANQNPVYPLTF